MGFNFQRKGKYNSTKETVDGITFDSRKEARRYRELRLLEKAGEISELRLQVPYELIPTQREPGTVGKRGAVHPGKIIEKSTVYIADFVYKVGGEEIVEDTKSDATRKKESYVIKRKLMLYLRGIRIKEV